MRVRSGGTGAYGFQHTRGAKMINGIPVRQPRLGMRPGPARPPGASAGHSVRRLPEPVYSTTTIPTIPSVKLVECNVHR